jgi:hypothetical protein
VARLELDFDDCGWLFVRTRNGTVAIDVKAAIEEDPDGSRSLLLVYRKPSPMTGVEPGAAMTRSVLRSSLA